MSKYLNVVGVGGVLSVALAFGLGAASVVAQPASVAGSTTSVSSAAATSKTSQTPDGLVRALVSDVMTAVKQDKSIQAGDVRKVAALVDSKILPYVNFQSMTASSVGRNWNSATPEQKKRLQEEFKNLLIYTYAGAVTQIRDQTVEVNPLRAKPEDTQVIVSTVVRGRGDPIQLRYRLEKAADGWRIYDVEVFGAWLVQTQKSSFVQEITASGIDGLIAKLAERNKFLASKYQGG